MAVLVVDCILCKIFHSASVLILYDSLLQLYYSCIHFIGHDITLYHVNKRLHNICENTLSNVSQEMHIHNDYMKYAEITTK